ncbi:DUF4883 family protein [Clostridium estertheticum]|uniref:DUF4883 family protein n=1 Tax=Clostridium estertheticum TaxID=238834 RepID=UPI0013E909C9|nr:DUF4883 family protein [Clostridium estertheticum]MBZ9688334.1 DUF4883 family protein [Clostridium estertheticum]
MSVSIKKYISIIICIFFSLTLYGCKYKFNKNIFIKNKPNTYYYTNLLMKDLSLEKPTELYALYMNFYKKKDFSVGDLSTFTDFFKSLNTDSFIQKPANLTNKPIYKIFLTFSKNKYIINVYNENLISIYPWDGGYSMDYIDTTKMYKAYNLYGLCKYLIPK